MKGEKGKASRDARKALDCFVNDSVGYLTHWLGQVANGIPQLDREGQPIRDLGGNITWIVKPDPGQAVKLITDAAEFVVPKLSRAEIATTLSVDDKSVQEMSTNELKRLVLQHLGRDALPGEYSTVQGPQEAITQPRAATDANPKPEPL